MSRTLQERDRRLRSREEAWTALNLPRKSAESARTGTSQASQRGESHCEPAGARALPGTPLGGRRVASAQVRGPWSLAPTIGAP
jgi:hypothetical protein